jgi:hypothetical protein
MTAKGTTAEPCEARAVCGGDDFKRVEPLWSPGSQPGANLSAQAHRQDARTRQTVAGASQQLPRRAHGKEGVAGSSPSEGLKYLQKRRTPVLFDLIDLHSFQLASGAEPLSSAHVSETQFVAPPYGALVAGSQRSAVGGRAAPPSDVDCRY